MTGMAFVERTGLSRRLPMAMLKIAFRRSRTVFFQNPDDRELFIKEDIVKSGIARLLPGSGIDLKRFKPTHPTENVGKGLKLLLIGRLLREKGIIEYIEAAEIVRHQRTDIEFQLLGFLGTANPSALTAAHVDSWANAGLVNYLGSAEDVRPFIAAADCVVLPSYREGLPRALLEGAAMGKPLIATDVPGCRAVVEQGVNGYLCEVRNSRSLADSILKLAELPTERRRELGSQGRLKVEREFSEAIVVKRYLEAIEKLGSF
jgi:glycosyltransferase involved in cell wall biosynthesis